MQLLRGMYLTMLPLILGGILNMIFTKTKLYKKYNKPIDGNKTFWDGKRIFGDNKTWIGFWSMIIFVAVSQVLCGLFCNALDINHWNDFYSIYPNTLLFNSIVGVIIGFVYMIFELPNSFVKRRIDIPSGKTIGGFRGCIFFCIDQIDSLVGVMLILYFVSGISIGKYFLYVIIGGLTHIIINLTLKTLKIRRNL